jgi:sulfide dehydrogenase cytochrome subunit
MQRPTPAGSALFLALAVSGASASESGNSPALQWNCNGCHGFEGASQGPLTPSIGGFDRRLFFTIMRGYQLDERRSTIMGRIAKGYTTLELREMADYFAGVPWKDQHSPAPEATIAEGEALHDEFCAECHDDGGQYQDKEIPRLKGQLQPYLLMRMEDYQQESKGLLQPPKMRKRLEALTAQEISALSFYYAR